MNTKEFSLGAVVTVITGRMLVTDIGDVYKILNFMCKDELFTHQLPRAIKECKPYLLEQFPQLNSFDKNELKTNPTKEEFDAFMEAKCAEYGNVFAVHVLPDHAHEEIDPMSELAEKIHPSKIIQIDSGE